MQRNKLYNNVWHGSALPCCFLGEANAQHNQHKYACTFPAMIDDWRLAFYAGSEGQTAPDFPFGFVQVMHKIIVLLFKPLQQFIAVIMKKLTYLADNVSFN